MRCTACRSQIWSWKSRLYTDTDLSTAAWSNHINVYIIVDINVNIIVDNIVAIIDGNVGIIVGITVENVAITLK